MEETKDEEVVMRKLGKITKWCFAFIGESVRMILFLFLMIGATAAFWQFLILYPEKALAIVEGFRPIIAILLQIVKWSFIVLFFSATVAAAYIIIKEIEKVSKKRNDKRREQFIKDLAKEIRNKK